MHLVIHPPYSLSILTTSFSFFSFTPLPCCPAHSKYSSKFLLPNKSYLESSTWFLWMGKWISAAFKKKHRRGQEGAVMGQSLPEKGKCCLLSYDFRTNRKHLDLAQERVLPPSKTGSPRMPGGACPLKWGWGWSVWAALSPLQGKCSKFPSPPLIQGTLLLN